MSLRILTTAAAAAAAMVISITAASAGCCACGCGYQPTYQTYYPAHQSYYPAPVPAYAPTPAYRVNQGPTFAVPAVTADEPVPEYGYPRPYPYVTYPHRHRVDYRRDEERDYRRSSRFYGPRPCDIGRPDRFESSAKVPNPSMEELASRPIFATVPTFSWPRMRGPGSRR